MATKNLITCQSCRTRFRGRRGAKTCSPACRKRLQRYLRQEAAHKAERLESALGEAFHQIAADLLKSHVLHVPAVLADERGAVMVPTLGEVPQESKTEPTAPSVSPVVPAEPVAVAEPPQPPVVEPAVQPLAEPTAPQTPVTPEPTAPVTTEPAAEPAVEPEPISLETAPADGAPAAAPVVTPAEIPAPQVSAAEPAVAPTPAVVTPVEPTELEEVSATEAAAEEPEDERPTRSRPLSLFRFNRFAFMMTGGAMAAIALLVIGGFTVTHYAMNRGGKAAKKEGLSSYNVGKLTIGTVQPSSELGVSNVSQLSINGLLKVNETIVITPTTTPANPVTGQIYVDKTNNTPYFYNGTQFISLTPEHVASLGGASGAITLGNGLSMTGNQLAISNALQQQINNNSIIAASGVRSLTGTPNQVNVSSSTGDVVLSLPQDIAQASSPTFSGVQLTGLGAGLVQSNASGLLSSGAVDRNSATYLTGTLAVGNGGTGATSFASNGILFGNGSGAVQATNSLANAVLVTNGSGAPSLSQTLPLAVQNNITQTGVLVVGSINNGFGAISTNNNITTTALVQAGSLEVDGGSFTIDNLGNFQSWGDGIVQGTLTLGIANSADGSLILADSGSAFTTTIQAIAQAGQNQTIILPASNVASDEVCLLTLGNCVGTGGSVVASGGIENYITKFTNAAGNQIGNSLLYDNGTSVGVGTNTPNASYLVDINGNLRVVGTTTLNSALTITTGGANITGNISQTGTGTFSTGTGAVSLNGNTSVTGSNTLTVGAGATTLGGTLDVTGFGTFNGGISVSNGAAINGTTNINVSGTANTFIGNATGTFGLTSSGLNVTTAGALSGITGYTQGSGNFAISGSGTFSTGTGAVSLNGTTTVAGALNVDGGSLTVGVPGTTIGNIYLANNSSTREVILQGLNPSGTGNATIQFPTIAGGSTDTVCLMTLGNCAASGAAGGDLTGTYPNPTIAKLQGTTLTLSSLASGDVLQYNGSAIVNGKITNSNLQAGTFTNITGVGALTTGSIASGFGTISTGNNITTTATVHGDTITGGTSNQFQVDASGNVTGGTVNSANISGGTLSGGTVSGGSLSATDVNGLSVAAGVITNPTIAGTVTGSGTPTVTGFGTYNGQTISSSANFTGTLAVQGSGGITVGVASTTNGVINLANSTNSNLSVITSSAPTGSGNATYNLPAIAGGGSDTFCLFALGNCAASGAAGGDLTGTYPNPTIAKLQGTTLTLSSLASGDVLQYNGSAIVNGKITNSNLQAGTFTNITGVGALTTGSIASGFGTISTGNNITTTATVQGGTLNATSAIQLGGTNINTAGTLTNVAYLNQANVFTAAQTISQTAATGLVLTRNTGSNVVIELTNTDDSTFIGMASDETFAIDQDNNLSDAPFKVSPTSGNINTSGTITSGLINGQTISSAANFTGTVSVLGASVSIGNPGTTAGSLYLANASSSRQVILQGLNPTGTGNAAIQIPSIAGGSTDTVCLVNLGNCAGSGGGIVGSGTNGTIPVFTGTGSIGDSVITQSGTAISVAGTLSVTGASSLTLGTASTNTGSIALKNSTNANTLTLQAGATGSNLTFTLPTADGSNGYCLQTNGSGVLSFNSCTGGAGGGVTSLDGLTGVLTLANSSGSGSTVTIDDASTSQKGIAQFNSTNFTASSGTINTVQDIATSSSPTFAALTLQNSGQAALQLTSTGANTGITIGGDTNLYRSAASTLKTDGTLNVVTAYQLNGTDINTAGTLTNVAYLNQANNFTQSQTISVNGGKTTLALTNTGTNTGITIGGDTNLYRQGAAVLQTDGRLVAVQSATGNISLSAKISTDTNDRFNVTGGGVLNFGPGNAVTDTNLYRSAADNLRSDDDFRATGLSVGADAGTNVLHVQGTASRYLQVDSSGRVIIRYNDNSTLAGPIFQNLDTDAGAGFSLRADLSYDGSTAIQGSSIRTLKEQLWTSTASTQDSSLVFLTAQDGSPVEAGRFTSARQLQLPGTGSSAGILIGGDANLYRSAADALQTDDSLTVTGNLTTNGNFTNQGTNNSSYLASIYNLSTNSSAGGLSVRVDQNGSNNILLNVQTGAAGNRLQLTGTGSLKIGNASSPTVGDIQILNDNANSSSGIRFGSALDTNLYRSAADTLKTDDSFIIGGSQFTNIGSTLNSASSLGDFPSGGAIGTAAATVDSHTSFAIAQTTAGQVLSLPSPTVTTAGRIAYVLNTGTTSFTMHSVTIPSGYGQIYVWNGTSWILGASGGGSAITLQAAYDGGNTLTTTDARDINVTLANTSSDGNFIINVASGSTGQLKVQNNGSDVLAIGSAGQLALSVQGTGGGLLIGGDATLYRSAANTLTAQTLNATIGINTGAGAGTQRLDASGNLVAIASLTGSGALTVNASGSNTISIGGTSTGDILLGGGSGSTGCTVTNSTGAFACTSTINGATLTGGSLSSSAVNGLSVSGGTITNPTIAGTVTGSGSPTITGFGAISAGTYNSQTISSAANFTGTLTVQGGGNTLSLGTASSNTGSARFLSASGSGSISLTPANPGSSTFTLTLPAENGTLCSTGSVCTGYAPSTGGNYIAKNATDTSSASATSGYLLGLTNSATTGTGGTLSVTNNSTGSALNILQSTNNPGGTAALILANNNTTTPSGYLLALQNKGTNELTVDVSGNINTLGGLTLGSLGTNDTNSVVCRNSTNQLALCSGSGAGAPFVQGGNSFGATAVLGTNDSNSLTFETNNATQATIAVGGATTFKNSTDSTAAFQVQNTGSTAILSVDTTNQQLTVTKLQSTGDISIKGPDGGSILIGAVANSGTGGNAMTFSGNEINDKNRAINLQGDGLQPPDSSTGVWESTTNLITNGGMESNITSWGGAGGNTTLTRDTSVSKFGIASLKTVTSPAAGSAGPSTPSANGQRIAVSANTAYTTSVWVKGDAASNGTAMRMIFREFDSANAQTANTQVNFTLTTSWQKVTLTKTTAATTVSAFSWVLDQGTTAQTFWIDGAQLEAKAFATPYVETNGSAATRNGARIQAPVSNNVDETQSWVAIRVRMGTASTDANVHSLFSWRDDSNNFIQVNDANGSAGFEFRRRAAGVQDSVTPSGQSWAAGDIKTVVFAWTSTQIKASIDGSAFQTVSSTNIPTLAATQFDLGSTDGSTGLLDGDYIWAASGTGTLTDADAAAINRYGNNDPSLAGVNAIDAASAPTFVWNGESTAYASTSNVPTLQSGITLDDATLYRSGAGALAIQGGTNSTTAFQIQNSAGTSIFTADTTNQRVAVGPSAVPANGILTIGTNTTTASGGIYFGTDTNLYRSAADVLKTDSNFYGGSEKVIRATRNSSQYIDLFSNSSGNFISANSAENNKKPLRLRSLNDGTGSPAGNTNISFEIGSASSPTVVATMTEAGQLQIPVTGSTAGLLIGGDANLYRSATDILTTDDSLTAGGATSYGRLTINGDAGATGPVWSSLSVNSPSSTTRYGGVFQSVVNGSSSNNAIGLQVDTVTNGGLNFSAVGIAASRVSSTGYAAGLLVDTVSSSGASSQPVMGAYINNISTNSNGSAYGLRIANVTNASANTGNTVSGITIENSITNAANATNLYAINSLSTAKSYFAGNVGIGNTAPQSALEVSGAADPTIRISEASSTTSYLAIQDTASTQARIDKVVASGSAFLDFNPLPSDGTSIANVRVGRATNTTGRVSLDIYKGDNSTTINNSFAGNGNSYVQANNGNFGIGDTSPAALLSVGNGDLFQVNSSGNVLFNQTAPTISIGNTGSLVFNDGTNTLCTITDAGTTGNLSCTGNITGASTGTVGYWSRSGTTLQPATAGDAVTTSGNISTTGSGTLSIAGNSTLTGNVLVGAPSGISTNVKLYVRGTDTDTGGTQYGQLINTTFQPTSDFNQSFYGFYSNPTITDSSAAGNLTGAYFGGRFQPVISNATRSVADVRALQVGAQTSGGAAVTNSYNLRIADTYTTTPVGTRYGLYVDQPSLSSGATIGTSYGIYLENQYQSASTTNYSIYSNGGNAVFNNSWVSSGQVAFTINTDSNIGSGGTATGLYINADKSGTGFGGTIVTALDAHVRSTSDTVAVFRTDSGDVMKILGTGNVSIGPLAVPANGVLTVGTDTTTAAGGIYFGTDTNLYRSAATELTTNADIVVQGGDLTTNQTTFNLINTTATTLNVGGAASTLNIGPGSTTATSINLAGGSGATGCTVDGATGNLTCSGAIATTATTGTQGWWSRSGTTLSPVNSGDSITTSGNISATGSGTLSVAGLSTLTGGFNTNGNSRVTNGRQLTVERNAGQYIFLDGDAAGSGTAGAIGQISNENNKKQLFIDAVHDSGGSAAGALGFVFRTGASSSPTNVLTIGETGLSTFVDDIVVQGGDLTTNQTTFNLINTTATTLNVGGAASTLNIGPGSTTATSINLAGGSGATGCTVDGATGNLTCSGNITGGSTGTVGYWTRTGTNLQPATAGDTIVGSTADFGNAISIKSTTASSSRSSNLQFQDNQASPQSFYVRKEGNSLQVLENSGGIAAQFGGIGTNGYINNALFAIGSASPANGVLTVGTNTTAASGGLYFGTDTNLYRSAADVLKTDDALVVTQPNAGVVGLQVTGFANNSQPVFQLTGGSSPNTDIFRLLDSTSADRLSIDFTGKLKWLQGTDTSTNLYRGGGNILKTDAQFQAAWTNDNVNQSAITGTNTIATVQAAGTSRGLNGLAKVTATTGTQGAVAGVWGSAEYAGATGVTVTSLASVVSSPTYSGASPGGTITNQYGFWAKGINNNTSGTPTTAIQNAYGMYIDTQGSSALGTQNVVGLFINTQTGGSSTNVGLQFNAGTSVATGIQWGTDTNLYRGVANGLRTDDQLQLSNSSTTCTAYATGAAESCIWFGSDTNLFRQAAATLQTTGQLRVVATNSTSGQYGLYVNNTPASGTPGGIFARTGQNGSNFIYAAGVGSDTPFWGIQGNKNMVWGDGGGTFDTNLYRSAADTLKTDDSLVVNGNSTVLGSTILGDSVGDLITANAQLLANGASTATTGTTTGTGTNTTTLTLTSDAFAVNDVVFIDNAAQDYYTRITADPGTGSYTVSPAVTFETGRTVTKYNIQNIGATTSDYTTQASRFFQGYFLGGIVAGAGSTIYGDSSIVMQGDTNLYRSAAGVLKTDSQLQATTLAQITSSSDYQLRLTRSGVANWDLNVDSSGNLSIGDFATRRLTINSSGQIAVGAGAVPANGVLTVGTNTTAATGGLYFGTDTNLYRDSADVLRTDSTFKVVSSAAAALDTYVNTGVNALQVRRVADSGIRLAVTDTGQLNWGDGTAAADTDLYRGSAGYLLTDGQFGAGGNILSHPGAASQTAIGNVGPGGEAGIVLGSSADTNLYRAGASLLKTDDDFKVANGKNAYFGDNADANGLQIGVDAGSNNAHILQANNASLTISTSVNGSLNLSPGGGSNTGVVVKPQTESTASFQVQNTASQSVLNVNTAAATISLLAPTTTYVGGADATGSTNSGTGAVTFNATAVLGKFMYAVTGGSATACSQSAGSAIGCELQVYNISNPAAPVYIGGADASGSTNSGTGNTTFQAIAISGDYAYVASGGSNTACSIIAGSAIGCELQIYNISNPAAPAYVGGADATGSTNSGTGSVTFTGIAVAGTYVYVSTNGNSTACSQTAGSAVGCELKAFDVSNPVTPTYAGGVDSTGSGTGTGSNGFLSVANSRGYVYVTQTASGTACSQTPGSGIGCELKAFSLSTPSTPAYVGGADASGSTNSGTASTNSLNYVTVTGSYAYVAQSASNGTCSQTAGSAIGCELKVFNVASPAVPTYVGGADGGGSTNSGTYSSEDFKAIAVNGSYAYVTASTDATACSQTAGTSGCELKQFNVSTAATPTYKGGLDAGGSTNTGTSANTFNWLAVSGRYAYVPANSNSTTCSQTAGSAIGCELKSVDISGIDTPSIYASSAETGTLQVDGDGAVHGDFSIQGSVSVGQNLRVDGNLGVGGSALFKNTTNSTTAFQIQSSVGNSLFTADTTNTQIIITSTTDGAQAGVGSGATGDTGGGGGGGINGGTPSEGGQAGDTGGQAVDLSGLFAVLTDQGFATTGPGAGGGATTGDCTHPGGNATGFGSGGGGGGWFGGNGGAGLYGGGGGGAAGRSCSQTGGAGGQGVVVISPVGAANTVKTSGTSYTVPAGVTTLKIWAVGAGGGGAGSTNVDLAAGGGGGGGGLVYRTFSVTPGQSISYSLGTAGAGGVGAANGTAGGVTTVTVGSVTLTAYGGGPGQYNTNVAGVAGVYLTSGDSPFKIQSNGGSSFMSVSSQGSVTVSNGSSPWGANGNNLTLCVDASCLDTIYAGYNYPTLKTTAADIGFTVNGSTFGGYVDNAGFHNVSDINRKENFEDLNFEDILGKINQLPVQGYNFKNDDPTVRHIGTFAQNFHDAFGLGGDENTTISVADEMGVTLAGVKALIVRTDTLNTQVQGLGTQVQDITDQMQNNNDFTDLNVSGTATINNLTATTLNATTATVGTLNVTSSATFAGNITVGGHIITASGQPTIEIQAAAGGGAAAVSVEGNDTTGTITITTGDNPVAGELAKILFSQDYGQPPRIVLSASNDKAAGLRFFKGTTTINNFMFNALDTPQANTTYKFDYFIAQ